MAFPHVRHARAAARLVAVLATLVAALAGAGRAAADGTPGDPAAGTVELHFFWSRTCPHCTRARPFVESLPARHPWLVVHSLDVMASADNVERYVTMAASLGVEARSVPAFIFCGRMITGFDSARTTGRVLAEALIACHEGRLDAASGPAPPVLPVLGALELERWSLPALTLVLAGLDSFNPCAFFVLLFLLSLLVHARSRARILVVGGIFVLFSGLVYFAFMAAWLNLFLLVGRLALVTTLAGAVAVVLGGLNLKDYAWLGRGPSLSIPERGRSGLFARMRRLVAGESLPALVLGAMALALAANAYELLCTAGFPMVFTRVLTLHEMPDASRYLYMALYNVVYVVPLAIVVLLFAATLGSRRLGEREGRVLKLASGLMMIQLGLALIAAPDLLANAASAAGMLLLAVAVTALVEGVRRARHRGPAA